MSTTPTYTPPSFAQSVSLVASREIRMRLRSKAFLVSTGILMLAVLASIIIGGVISNSTSTSTTPVAVVGSAQEAVAGNDALEVTDAATVEAAEDLVRDGTVDAAVIPSDDPLGFSIVALDSVPSALMMMLSETPSVQLLDTSGPDGLLLYLVALGFGLVFFMSAITFGGAIASSVVEEKQTRVVEILLSAVPARAMLAGKVAGNSLLAFGQIVMIAVLAGVGLLVSGQDVLLAGLGPALGWFVVFFAIGFVLLASMFAAASALVSRLEDVNTVISPVTMLVMLPYFLVIIFNDNEFVLAIMSYVPFSAPVGMPMRIVLGTAEWWEPLLSLAIMVGLTGVIVALGARIYENSLLRTGARVKLLDALRG
ncbi:MAG: ABC transporter permease [Microbacteriaceae bacterium]